MKPRYLSPLLICLLPKSWSLKMKLLFVIHKPLLPLEALRPHWSEAGPCAVLEQGLVVSLSTEAKQQGVRKGMGAELLGVYGVWQSDSGVRHLVAKRLVDHSRMLEKSQQSHATSTKT